VPYSFTVNGRLAASDASGLTPLISVLRDELGLRGAKLGCGEGRCGACTVLIDGQPVASCLYPLANADNAVVRTVEGLAAPDGPLTPIQDALLSCGGIQCGACIPGIVMTLTALLEGATEPDDASVRDELAGNICRCTGYQKIIDATLRAAGARSDGETA
jgi:aerobic-type carbon monoxide dehydrogenase small subunit (CoxS/CutS family)